MDDLFSWVYRQGFTDFILEEKDGSLFFSLLKDGKPESFKRLYTTKERAMYLVASGSWKKLHRYIQKTKEEKVLDKIKVMEARWKAKRAQAVKQKEETKQTTISSFSGTASLGTAIGAATLNEAEMIRRRSAWWVHDYQPYL